MMEKVLQKIRILLGERRIRNSHAIFAIGLVALIIIGGATLISNRDWRDGLASIITQSPHPQGFVDRAVVQLCTISGWANDPDTTEPITVEVYKGAPLGEDGSILVGDVQANLARGDGLPGFSFTFPSGFDSTFYAYAVGVDASGTPDIQRLLSLYSPEVPSPQLTCDEGPDSDEGSNDVSFSKTFDFDLEVRLGEVEPIVRMNDFGIRGVNPDGHIGAQVVGSQVNTYFTCSDGSTTLTCLSENSSIDDFGDLSGLHTDTTGQVFQTVMEGKVPGDAYEDKYASLVSIWRDPTTGLIHGWYHAETFVNRDGCPAPVTYAAVGYAISQDDGKSFAKQGMVLTSDAMKDPSACVGQGTAHPKVIQAGEYIYMFYDSWPPVFSEGGIAVARAHVSNPGEWFKYYNGGFSELGIAGQDTPVIARGGANGSLWHPSVFWSPYLNSYLMVHSNFLQEGALFLRASPDLLSWSSAELLVEVPARWGYRYATFLTDDNQAKTGWLYFGRHPKDGRIGPDTLLARRSVHFDPDITPPPPPPPPPSEVEVFTDSFEVNEWNGLWSEDSQNDWRRRRQRATDGSYSAELDGRANDATLTSMPINLQGRTSATITFSWLIERRLDNGEYLAFDISTDGGSSWAEYARLRGNVDTEDTWHNGSFNVSGISNLQIRFRGSMSRSNEDANVDDVRVTAL